VEGEALKFKGKNNSPIVSWESPISTYLVAGSFVLTIEEEGMHVFPSPTS